jgi:cold shock CspA family protein
MPAGIKIIFKTYLKPSDHSISSYTHTDMSASKYGDSVYTGCVKWFNRQGWGFLTITNEGHSDEDIFVRWDNLTGDGYKYLVQGEYVEFTIEHKPDAQDGREYQAANVAGVNGGKLMCETRHEQKVAAAKHRQQQRVNQQPQAPLQRQYSTDYQQPPVTQVPVHQRLSYPAPLPGHQWVLVPQPQVQNQRPPRQPRQQYRN